MAHGMPCGGLDAARVTSLVVLDRGDRLVKEVRSWRS